jgi:hypothetical protein
MEPEQVIAIDQSPEDVLPWPRIIRAVAVGTIFFALINLLEAAVSIYWYITYTGPGSIERYVLTWHQIQVMFNIMAIVHGSMSAFIAAAAFTLLKRGRGQQLLTLSLRLWLLIWVVEFGVRCFAFGMQNWQYLAVTLVNGLINAALPVAVLLALREYSIDGRRIEAANERRL